MTKPMKQDVKTLWVKALRSGEYKQNQGRLRDGDSFCCLGVLCDVVQSQGWIGDEFFYGSDTDSYETSLPLKMNDELQLSCSIETELIQMNDDEGKSFSEIADYIEANL